MANIRIGTYSALLYVAGRFMAVRIDYCGKRLSHKASAKLQASVKLQATSLKQQAPSIKRQAASIGALSHKLLDHGSCIKFWAAMTVRLDKINVCVGCGRQFGAVRNAFYSLLLFSSIVKNPRFSWYPTRSGKPKDAQDSMRVQIIPGVFFLNFLPEF